MNIYIIIGIVAFVILFFIISYVKTPPKEAMIISGLSRQPRVLIGKGGFRIPFFERIDRVFWDKPLSISKPARPCPPTTSSMLWWMPWLKSA